MPHHKDKSKPTRTTLKMRRTNPKYNIGMKNKETSFLKLMKVDPYKTPKIKSVKDLKKSFKEETKIVKEIFTTKSKPLKKQIKKKVIKKKEPEKLERNIIL